MPDQVIVPLEEVAARYPQIAERTLRDRRWRDRVRLPAVKLGGKIIGFRASDLRRALRRERLTPNGGGVA